MSLGRRTTSMDELVLEPGEPGLASPQKCTRSGRVQCPAAAQHCRKNQPSLIGVEGSSRSFSPQHPVKREAIAADITTFWASLHCSFRASVIEDKGVYVSFKVH